MTNILAAELSRCKKKKNLSCCLLIKPDLRSELLNDVGSNVLGFANSQMHNIAKGHASIRMANERKAEQELVELIR
jgi:hypothetical protein